MAARAMWKAQLALGRERVPIKLYSAAIDRKIHFKLLHKADRAPVRQQMIDPISEHPVASEEIRRGVEVEEGVFVLLDDEELQTLEPKASRLIQIEQALAPAAIDMRCVDRPYYLGPDGDEEGYFALAEALDRRHRVGLARWVMRKKRYSGLLFNHQGYLLLQTLRHADELVYLEEVQAPRERMPDPRERTLAEQLIDALAESFDPAAYRDRYQERLSTLVKAKAGGAIPKAARRAKKAPEASLVEELEASLKGKRRAHG